MKGKRKFTRGGIALICSFVLVALLCLGLLPAQAGFLPGGFYYRTNYYGPTPLFSLLAGLKKISDPDSETVELSYDDGEAEIYTGSYIGGVVVANRFAIDKPVRLDSVSFYTSSLSIGQNVEVIIYEDTRGMASLPNPSMEVLRLSTTLQELPGMDDDGEFQQVSTGDLLLNAFGREAAFFVGIYNIEPAHYSLGIDLSSPNAGASYISDDSGQTYEPLSGIPIIDGNVMIRARIKS